MKTNTEISNGVKKIGAYLLYGGALFFALALIGVSVKPDKKTELASSGASDQTKSSQKVEDQETKSAEKVQVYAFHSTNRCYSCITMGQYVGETVEEFFQPELRSGKIEFKEINVDLPENREVAKKFKAAGSSLFLNAIIDGEDNIKEEAQAWRLLGDQKAFADYLSKKIRSMIGETVSAQDKKEVEEKNITFYVGDNCAACENIKKYLDENDLKNQIDFEEKNVNQSEADSEQMAEDAMRCEVDPESFGVPFLWAEGSCYTNEKAIINFFAQKI